MQGTVLTSTIRGFTQKGAILGRMSEPELKDVSNFFKSASGKKYIEQQPLVLNALYVSMQSWQQQMSQDMMTRVREEMKKKGHEM